MFVFKEAPLHAELTAQFLSGSPVRRLGLVAWPGCGLPAVPGVEIHHVYSPSPALLGTASACNTIFLSSAFSLHALKKACTGQFPCVRLSLEAGDGRDGALPEELSGLAEQASRLGLPLSGLAVNFACLSSRAPTRERLRFAERCLGTIQDYCLLGADISAGGTDMLEMPDGFPPGNIREIRCGTGAMLGIYPLSGHPIPEAREDAFRLEAYILECRVKSGRRTALLDFGTFHTAPECLIAPFPAMTFSGSSSAYTVFDVTDCPEQVQEGSTLFFRLDYHALSRSLTSQALPFILENA